MKLDLKTLIGLLTLAATLGGFYYTTQSRLDNLEKSVEQIERRVNGLKRQIAKEKRK
tara:strand:+ start:8100 stop:8270 length:171 start_codon:yes stop_codon:yes gene_type:complete